MAYSDNLNKLMHEPNEQISTVIQGLIESTRTERARRDVEPELGDISTTTAKVPLVPTTGPFSPGEKVRIHSRYYKDMLPHEAALYQGLWVIDYIEGSDVILRGCPANKIPVTELLRLTDTESEQSVTPSERLLPSEILSQAPSGTSPMQPTGQVSPYDPWTMRSPTASPDSVLPPSQQLQTGAYTPPGTPPTVTQTFPTGAYTPPGTPPTVSPPYAPASPSNASVSPPYAPASSASLTTLCPSFTVQCIYLTITNDG